MFGSFLLNSCVAKCSSNLSFKFQLAHVLFAISQHVPQRFAKKMGLLNYKSGRREGREGDGSPLGADHRPIALPQNRGQWSAWFPSLWDRIIDFMRYEDKPDDYMASHMKFKPGILERIAGGVEKTPEFPTSTPSHCKQLWGEIAQANFWCA